MKFLFSLLWICISIMISCQTEPGTLPIHPGSGPGEHIQISLSVKDLTTSVNFYSQLGFRILTIDKNAPVPWAFISDGKILFMLSQNEFPSPSLVYYTANFNQKIQTLKNFRLLSDGTKRLKTAVANDPEGIGISLIEMKSSFLPSIPTDMAVIPGTFIELSIPVSQLEASRDFWLGMGFTPHSTSADSIWIFSDRLLTIGLYPQAEFHSAALTYYNHELTVTRQKLQSLGWHTQTIETKGKLKIAEIQFFSPDGQLFRLVTD